MQKIDINTTQNVTIQYELAAWKDRVFAYIIDMVVLFGGIFLVALTLELVLPQLSTVIMVLLLFFYTLKTRKGKKTFGGFRARNTVNHLSEWPIPSRPWSHSS